VTAEVLEATYALVEENRTRQPARSPLMLGTWRLRFTNSIAVWKNKGITGVGALIPFSELITVEQHLDKDGISQVVEILSAGPGRLTNTLTGTFQALSEDSFEYTYESAKLGPFQDLQYRSRATMQIPYISNKVRIAKASSDIFVFDRVAP